MRLASILVVTLVLVSIWGCAVNPATGKRELTLFSESQEIQMGKEADPQVVASIGLYPDEGLQGYVNDLGRRLASNSERPDLPWTFRIVDDPAVNAFAIPGGYIYVTRGILASLNSEAELAGVMGHEIGHITARHSVTQMSQQQLQQLGLGIGMAVVEDLREYSGVIQTGLAVLNLKYSRGDESEADMLGFRYMTRLRYDPNALVGVFQTLALVSGDPGDRLPEWQLTHPYPENREASIQAMVRESGQDFSDYTIDRNVYLRKIDGLVYGPNPREGFFRDDRFHHPDLAFRMDFPPGWKGVNQKTAVGAISPQEDAILVLSMVPEGQTPRQALAAFLGQEGIEGGPGRDTQIHGLPAARAAFTARTEGGSVNGEAAYVAHGGHVYQILGYGDPASWNQRGPGIRASLESFQQETDAAVLAVKPARLDIVELPRSMTLQEFHHQYASTVPMEELGRINRASPETRLTAGSLAKRVVGGEIP
jgi:predicted Zn-dependent protease